MIGRTRDWINERLDTCQKQGRLYVAHEKSERERLRKAVNEGLVQEVMPQAFVRESYWSKLKPTAQMRLRMKSLLESDSDLVFAGATAALAYGLAVSNRHLECVCVATSRKTHRRAGEGIKSIIVTGDEPVKVEGIKVTSLPRTLYDCLKAMDFRSGLALADSALRLSADTPSKLISDVEASCTRMQYLRRVRAVLRLSDGRSESGGESIARATMLELGMAQPELQRVFHSPIDPEQHYRVDFAWDIAGSYVLGELDGSEKYLDSGMRGQQSIAHVIEREHRRQSHIEALQEVLRVVRFGFSDVMDEWGFLRLLVGCGVPRTYAMDDRVVEAGGILRCR